MAGLIAILKGRAVRAVLPYIAVLAVCAGLVLAWQWSIDRAYDRGVVAAQAEQQAVDAQTVINIWKEYSNATGPNLSLDAAECILRAHAGNGGIEDCGDL